MDVTDVTGPFGPWQKRTMYVLMYSRLPMALVFLTIQSNLELDHWCARDDALNVTVEEWRSWYVPQGSKCEKYVLDSDGIITNKTMTCDAWEFEPLGAGVVNIRKEWTLVCHRTWLFALCYTLTTFGNFLMYIPSGYIADRYGRKITCMVGTVMLVIVGSIGYFSPNIEFFLVIRFLIGIAYCLLQSTSLCLFVEAVGPEYRLLMSTCFLGSWGVGMMMMAWVAYEIPNWRTLHLINYIPLAFISIFLFWKYTQEPPRWLLTVGKYAEAEKIICDGAKMNGIDILDREGIMKSLEDKIEKDKKIHNAEAKASILDLFRTAALRRMTLVLWSTMILMSFVGSGFYFSVDQLAGSYYLNVFFMGLTDFIATFIFILEMKYVSRRRSLIVNYFVNGVCFLFTLAIPDNMMWLRITVAMLGKTCNTVAYTIHWMFMTEIFPTNLRVIGVSGGMTGGRIGSILATYAGELGRVAGKDSPMILFGVLAITTSLMVLLLPETRGKHLPDTIKQSERLPDPAKTESSD